MEEVFWWRDWAKCTKRRLLSNSVVTEGGNKIIPGGRMKFFIWLGFSLCAFERMFPFPHEEAAGSTRSTRELTQQCQFQQHASPWILQVFNPLWADCSLSLSQRHESNIFNFSLPLIFSSHVATSYQSSSILCPLELKLVMDTITQSIMSYMFHFLGGTRLLMLPVWHFHSHFLCI